MSRFLLVLALGLTACVPEPEPFSITIENDTNHAWLLPVHPGEGGFDVRLGYAKYNLHVSLFMDVADPVDSCLPLCNRGEEVAEDCPGRREWHPGSFVLMPGDSVTRSFSGEASEFGPTNDCLEEGPPPLQFLAEVCGNPIANDEITGEPPAQLTGSGPADYDLGAVRCAGVEAEEENLVRLSPLLMSP